MGQPLTALMGGNDWAGSAAHSWGIRGTTSLGKRNTFVTKSPFRCKDGKWVQLLGNDVGRHLSKMPALLGVSQEKLLGPDLRSIDWSAANRVADEIFAQKTLAE